MKYLLSSKIGFHTQFIICDFENGLSSKWQPTKEQALSTTLISMDKYWSTARKQHTDEILENYLLRCNYYIVERISDKPQPYEYW